MTIASLQFPTYLFHADGRIVRVETRNQADALGAGWGNDPSVSAGKETVEVPLIKVMQDLAKDADEPFHSTGFSGSTPGRDPKVSLKAKK